MKKLYHHYCTISVNNFFVLATLIILFFSLISSPTAIGQNPKLEKEVKNAAEKKKKKKKAKLPPADISGTMLTNAQYNFTPSTLNGVVLTNPTSLQFGPDGRLYVSEQGGIIKAFTIIRNAANTYTVSATEIINLINLIPNHNDDGTLNAGVKTRQVTGILVTGTAANPVIYVTSSDSRIGGPGGDTNLDTNSGIISSITKSGTAWVKIDLVRGLPRSEENHASNGIQLDKKTNILYVAQGGNTNAGSPSTNFDYACETALSAAILSVKLDIINAMPTNGSGNTAYKYDLPTVDDPTRSNNPDGTDANDPFGGNNGLNQARIGPGPVQVYSAGYRNPYDLVITKLRNMYTISNGANQGWGGYPENEGKTNVTNNYLQGEPGSTSPSATQKTVNNLDNFHFIGNIDNYVPGTYYGGHPDPLRANPAGAGLYTHFGTTGVWRTSKTGSNPLPSDWPPVPIANANAVESHFYMPGVADKSLLTFTSSTDGIAEYTASNFNGALKGSLLACSYNGGSIDKISLTATGNQVMNTIDPSNRLNQDLPFASNFGNQPLDITAQGDADIFPGTVWVAAYGANSITVFEPQGFLTCSGLYNTADDDGDHFTNSDEIDNGTNPCSSASIPPDNDHDFISDLNDPDDDNDGIPDTTDPFAWDANNGLTAKGPIKYNLFNNDPGTGFFGLGFTGLMTNLRTDYNELYNDSNLIAGGAVGAFSVVAASAGDAVGGLNTQENAFQFGIKAVNVPFTVGSRMLGPFFNNQIPKGFQSQGIYIGNGDQDNYLKITLNANGGPGGIQIVYENAGVVVKSAQFPLTGALSAPTLDLFLSADPISGTVQPQYSLNGGQVINVGSPIQTSGAVLNAIKGSITCAVGIICTSSGGSPFTATWDYINVTNSANSWQVLNPNSGTIISREESGYAVAGGKFYLIGGRGILPIQEFNPVTKSWVNKSNTPIEMNHFQAVTFNSLVYVLGAMNGTFPHEVTVPQVYVYNPATDKWTTSSTIPSTRRRGAAGTVVYNNKIYMVGGIIDGHWSGWVNWFDEYNPATNTWKIMPNAPRVRDHFQAAIINNKLYLVGGRRTSQSTNQLFNLTIPEVDVYDFVSGKWSTLPSGSNLPTPRAGASTVMSGNDVIVIGGESGIQTLAHKETHALNVTTNTWRRLADLQQGRHGTGAVVSNNAIYIASGPPNRGGCPCLTSQEIYLINTPVTPSTQVTTFTLVNSTTDHDIQTLTNGAVLNLATLGKNLNIRANTNPPSVGSVVFDLSGQQTRRQVETSAPYSLFGDNNGNYIDWTPTVGSYALKGTPYSAANGGGAAGTPLSISFSVINQASAIAKRPAMAREEQATVKSEAGTFKAYPNPNSRGRYTVTLPEKYMGELFYSLMSSTGTRLTAGKLSLKKLEKSLNFDFSDKMISSGQYYLNLQGKDLKGQVKLMLLK